MHRATTTVANHIITGRRRARIDDVLRLGMSNAALCRVPQTMSRNGRWTLVDEPKLNNQLLMMTKVRRAAPSETSKNASVFIGQSPLLLTGQAKSVQFLQFCRRLCHTQTGEGAATFSSSSHHHRRRVKAKDFVAMDGARATLPQPLLTADPMNSSSTSTTAPTFFVTDRRMLAHKCEWDQRHIDGPERLAATLDMLENEHLIERCQQLDSAECSMEDLRLVHTQEHIDRIREASELPNLEKMEHFCAGFEDIYLNRHSWECALLSAGSAVKAMEAVLHASLNGQLQANSFAAIRPPGHHASQDTPCGFCLFNNARAIGVQKVLILDWDVHAAQGTQYCVEDDPGIMLISAHRYENGQFWPELPESGILHQYPNTINIPLNEIGYGDAEYAALMHFLVLPFIQQWQPELILVSCGFDSALGDPQGEMEVSPAGFGYMTGLLTNLGIPLCLVLEGGYFLPSVVQSTLFCIRALLERTSPVLNFCQRPPSPVFLRTLFTTLLVHSKQYHLFNTFIEQLNSLRLDICTAPDRRKRRELAPILIPSNFNKDYLGDRKPAQLAMANHTYATRGQYPPREPAVERHFMLRLQQLLDNYAKGPVERALLEFELGPGGKVLIMRAGQTNGSRVKEVFQLESVDQLLIFYYYLLLPLNFTYFDVRVSKNKLPLNSMQLAELGAKLEQGLVQNGHAANGERLDLDHVLDVFAQMKPFFLF